MKTYTSKPGTTKLHVLSRSYRVGTTERGLSGNSLEFRGSASIRQPKSYRRIILSSSRKVGQNLESVCHVIDDADFVVRRILSFTLN